MMIISCKHSEIQYTTLTEPDNNRQPVLAGKKVKVTVWRFKNLSKLIYKNAWLLRVESWEELWKYDRGRECKLGKMSEVRLNLAILTECKIRIDSGHDQSCQRFVKECLLMCLHVLIKWHTMKHLEYLAAKLPSSDPPLPSIGKNQCRHS